MAVLRRSYSTCMLRARRRTCLFRLELLQLASFPFFHAGPLCAWQLILRLSESEESLTGTCTQGVLLLEHCYVLRKFAQALLRLDRIIIQLFAMLGHYLRVFLLLFVVEKNNRSARPFSPDNIFGQTVSRNCFGVVNARNETRADGTPVRLREYI